MTTQGIFKGTFELVEKAMDLRSTKHNVVMSNIANMDTPNYKAFDVVIEEEMEKTKGTGDATVVKKTHQRHLSGRNGALGDVRPTLEKTQQTTLRKDGNTVDLDREMAKLSENNLMYDALAQIISKKFQGLKDVIKGGQ
ncbi:MAG: flagellar basal body rod protein FlgB [Deltaproteobacteria bacterium]|nr:flagellar basal body rod protein FlgB [Deltaproteobacteria bacterium]